MSSEKSKLPVHPKKHHKPFRWRHFGFFALGLVIGIFGFQRGGYIETREFDVNQVTPATVRIYSVVCGTVKYQGQTIGQNSCEAATGSGFIISKDGYIATSGHVVVHEAADVMAKQLGANPLLLSLLAAEARPNLKPVKDESNEAAFLRQLYSLPDDKLNLENRREVVFAALSDRPLVFDQKNPEKIFDITDSDYLKKAEIVATDYASEDILNVNSKTNDGFSAHDVALLKIKTHEAPVLPLSSASSAKQNDPITLIGFPTDADNQLTANDIISPSVTGGNISSIRTTTGKISRLFQTDADASRGSSGGPALNKNGEVIGIVTYRFKDKEETSAAKSYIREINDLKELLSKRSIALRTDSKTDQYWRAGLEFAAQHKYTKAIEQYKLALGEYPAHRLARSYITQAEQAVREGKNVKEPPYALIVTLGAVITGMIMVIGGAVLISHHHFQYRRYKNSFTN